MANPPVRFYLAETISDEIKQNFELRKAYEISRVVKNKF